MILRLSNSMWPYQRRSDSLNSSNQSQPVESLTKRTRILLSSQGRKSSRRWSRPQLVGETSLLLQTAIVRSQKSQAPPVNPLRVLTLTCKSRHNLLRSLKRSHQSMRPSKLVNFTSVIKKLVFSATRSEWT